MTLAVDWNPFLAELIPEGQRAEYPLLPPSLVQHYSVGYDLRTPPLRFAFSAHWLLRSFEVYRTRKG